MTNASADTGENEDDEHDKLFDVFKKIINGLQFNLQFDAVGIDKSVHYEKEQFDDMLKNIDITDDDVKASKTRGKVTKDDKYDVIQMVLSRFGIKLTAKQKTVDDGKKYGKRKKIKLTIGYDFHYVNDVYEIVFCKVYFKKNKYENKFIQFLNNFDTYKNCLDMDPLKHVSCLPYLFN